MHAAGAASRRQYRTVGVHRGDTDQAAEERKHELRTHDAYMPCVANNTQFFSTLAPEVLLGEIKGYLDDHKCKVTINPKKYKLKAVA